MALENVDRIRSIIEKRGVKVDYTFLSNLVNEKNVDDDTLRWSKSANSNTSWKAKIGNLDVSRVDLGNGILTKMANDTEGNVLETHKKSDGTTFVKIRNESKNITFEIEEKADKSISIKSYRTNRASEKKILQKAVIRPGRDIRESRVKNGIIFTTRKDAKGTLLTGRIKYPDGKVLMIYRQSDGSFLGTLINNEGEVLDKVKVEKNEGDLKIEPMPLEENKDETLEMERRLEAINQVKLEPGEKLEAFKQRKSEENKPLDNTTEQAQKANESSLKVKLEKAAQSLEKKISVLESPEENIDQMALDVYEQIYGAGSLEKNGDKGFQEAKALQLESFKKEIQSLQKKYKKAIIRPSLSGKLSKEKQDISQQRKPRMR